jgi:hypothetical protein
LVATRPESPLAPAGSTVVPGGPFTTAKSTLTPGAATPAESTTWKVIHASLGIQDP